ncbi:hypothetical protein SESBI_07208 [Sesbania bispinosa]|nr:hypothetical protein SESBI_07208 [Sesbania bispinosa]
MSCGRGSCTIKGHNASTRNDNTSGEGLGILVQPCINEIIPNHPKDDGVQASSVEAPHSHMRLMSCPKASHKNLLQQLYVFCAFDQPKEEEPEEYFIKMFNCYLSRWDLTSMKPCGCVCNMVFLLAPKVFMAHKVGSKGNLTRCMLTSRLVVRITAYNIEMVEIKSILE